MRGACSGLFNRLPPHHSWFAAFAAGPLPKGRGNKSEDDKTMATFKFELVSPERILMSVDADQVVVPGADGDFAVLSGHAPVITTLRPGVIDVTAGTTRKRLFVKGGFAEVDPERLTVLAQKAYDVDEMSASIVSSELSAAEAELAAATDDEAKMMADTLVSELKRLAAKAA